MTSAESGDPLAERVDRLQREVRELRTSRRRLAQAADADRRAIERAVHDGIQQDLVVLAIGLRRLAGSSEGDTETARVLDELSATVRDAIEHTAALAQRIYPPVLETSGLASALRAAAEGAGVALVVDGRTSDRHASEVIAAVYWSCVDMLGAASPGSLVSVRLRDARGTLRFEVAIAGALDDDRLHRLRDRVEALDGRISVEHDRSVGSRVHGWLPSPP